MTLDVRSAHEVAATLLADHLTGATATIHGDDYEITRTHLHRSGDGWPVAVIADITDDTGHTIRLTCPVEAQVVTHPVDVGRVCTVYGAHNGIICGAPAGATGRCGRHERGAA